MPPPPSEPPVDRSAPAAPPRNEPGASATSTAGVVDSTRPSIAPPGVTYGTAAASMPPPAGFAGASIPPPPAAGTGPFAAYGALRSPPATASMMPTVIHLPPRRTLTPWLVGLAAVALVFVFRQALAMAFVAFSIAYVFAPLVRRVTAAGVPRPLAILLVLVGGTALLVGSMAALVPELMRQLESLMRSIPDYSAAIQRDWIPYLRHHWHLRIPPRTEDALGQLGLRASSIAPRIGSILNDTLGYTIVVLEYLFRGLIVLALTFYILLEFDPILHGAFELVPHRARLRVRTIALEIDDTLRHFVNGQLLVMGVLGVLYALGLGLLNVPAFWAIGIFAGMISFVPYLGFFVALGLAILMAALQGRGIPGVLAVTGVMTAVHILDLTLITPRILGGGAKISPIVVILALIAGGSVFGFVGILVAIPVASVLRVLLGEVVHHYKASPFFLSQGPQGALASVPLSAPNNPLATDLTAALFAAPPTGTLAGPLNPNVPMPNIPPLAPPPPVPGAPGEPSPVAAGASTPPPARASVPPQEGSSS